MFEKLNKMLEDIKLDIDKLKIPTNGTYDSEYVQERISTVRSALSNYTDWCNWLIADIRLNPADLKFDNFVHAESELKDIIWDIAAEECEGSHNFGQNRYDVQFTVDGVKYHGTFDVDYDRHDKRYYFVDQVHNFQYTKAQQ